MLAKPAIDSAVLQGCFTLHYPAAQWVIGPVQDDEALLLFAIVRGMRLGKIFEARCGRLCACAWLQFAPSPTQG